MKSKIFIMFSRNGIKSLHRKTRNLKSIPAGTYLAELNLEVDDSFFDNQIPVFNMKLEAENIVRPEIVLQVVKQKKSFMEMSFSLFDRLTGGNILDDL